MHAVADPPGALPAAVVVGQTPSLREPRLLNGVLYWLEQRPHEGGRTTLLRRLGPESQLHALLDSAALEPETQRAAQAPEELSSILSPFLDEFPSRPEDRPFGWSLKRRMSTSQTLFRAD